MLTLSRKINMIKNKLGNVQSEIRFLEHTIYNLECDGDYVQAEKLKRKNLKHLQDKEQEWSKELEQLSNKKKKEVLS